LPGSEQGFFIYAHICRCGLFIITAAVIIDIRWIRRTDRIRRQAGTANSLGTEVNVSLRAKLKTGDGAHSRTLRDYERNRVIVLRDRERADIGTSCNAGYGFEFLWGTRDLSAEASIEIKDINCYKLITHSDKEEAFMILSAGETVLLRPLWLRSGKKLLSRAGSRGSMSTHPRKPPLCVLSHEHFPSLPFVGPCTKARSRIRHDNAPPSLLSVLCRLCFAASLRFDRSAQITASRFGFWISQASFPPALCYVDAAILRPWLPE
jgi:hypothetical protein